MYGRDLLYLSGFVRVSVPDVEAAADWYRAALGFGPIAAGVDETGPWRHLRRGEGQDLVLAATAGRARLRARATLASAAARLGIERTGPLDFLAVDRDPAAVAGEAREQGARVETSGASVIVTDPFGNPWALYARQPAARASAPLQPAQPPRRTLVAALRRRRARSRAWRRRA